MSYTVIDNDILRIGNKLKSNEFRVLIVLMSYKNKDKGFAYPSHSDLMRDCAIKDKGTLIKVINELEEKGFIEKETIKGKGNKYYIQSGRGKPVGKNHTSMGNSHTSSMEKPYNTSMENSHTINTNTITNKNTKYIDAFSEIFKFWNENKIIVHKKHNDLMLGAYKKVLKNFSDEEIKEAIGNYKEVLESDFYYSHKFPLDKFLSQKNAISNFVSEGMIYVNYLEQNKKAPVVAGTKEFKKSNYNQSICNNQNKYTRGVEIL